VGIGFGSKGMLFREYTDIWALRYKQDDWRTIIDGVEVFEGYISNLQREIYDHIFVGDILKIGIGDYDLIYLGDVIEHFEKGEGIKLIKDLLSHCLNLIIVTPRLVIEQKSFMGNTHEIHRSQWVPDDFIGATVGMIDGALIAEFEKTKDMR
jgi:hypothetical protein